MFSINRIVCTNSLATGKQPCQLTVDWDHSESQVPRHQPRASRAVGPKDSSSWPAVSTPFCTGICLLNHRPLCPQLSPRLSVLKSPSSSHCVPMPYLLWPLHPNHPTHWPSKATLLSSPHSSESPHPIVTTQPSEQPPRSADIPPICPPVTQRYL